MQIVIDNGAFYTSGATANFREMFRLRTWNFEAKLLGTLVGPIFAIYLHIVRGVVFPLATVTRWAVRLRWCKAVMDWWDRDRLRPISTSANFDFGQFLDVEFWNHKGWALKGGVGKVVSKKGGAPKGLLS